MLHLSFCCLFSILFLFASIEAINDPDDVLDLLLPYSERYGQPQIRRVITTLHRDIRQTLPSLPSDCGPVNDTTDADNHVLVPPNEEPDFDDIKKISFAWKSVTSNRIVRGHAIRMSQPNRQVSVRHAGCGDHLRDTVSNQVLIDNRMNNSSPNYDDDDDVATNSSRHHPHCIVATNAGLFNTHSGECYGNLVSFSEPVIPFSWYRNAHFGVLSDGNLFFGYVTKAMWDKMDFTHLVGGVIWLLKNDDSYVDESLRLECEKVEETGDLETFVNVQSARVAVGSDSHGRLWLVHVDGQSWESGVNLREMASLLRQEFDIMNAINLDGGGSATMVWRDVLINYPSDRCSGAANLLCERPVTSIMCVSAVTAPMAVPVPVITEPTTVSESTYIDMISTTQTQCIVMGLLTSNSVYVLVSVLALVCALSIASNFCLLLRLCNSHILTRMSSTKNTPRLVLFSRNDKSPLYKSVPTSQQNGNPANDAQSLLPPQFSLYSSDETLDQFHDSSPLLNSVDEGEALPLHHMNMNLNSKVPILP